MTEVGIAVRAASPYRYDNNTLPADALITYVLGTHYYQPVHE